MRFQHKKWISRAVFLLLTALLTGCAAGPQTTQPTQTAPGRTVRYGLSSAWDTLMPYNSPSGSNYSRIVWDKIYDRLAYVGGDGTLSPRGAKRWENGEDGQSVRFYLDERAAFHDGEAVTAQHWEETIRLLTDPACPTLGRSAFSVLAGTDESGAAISPEQLGVHADGAYELVLTFQSPMTAEEFLLEYNREFYVLPTHLFRDVGADEVFDLPLWEAPVGSGPCVFQSQLAGNSMVLTANRAYQLGAPGFDELVLTVIDKSNLLTALIAGDLDYYGIGGSISRENAEIAKKAGFQIQQGDVPNMFYELMLNNESLSDSRVRRAIEYAVDKERLCVQVSQGLGSVCDSELLPGTRYAVQSSGIEVGGRDLVTAGELLRSAGCAGATLTMACTESRAAVGAMIQQDLQQAGLDVRVETVDSATLFSGMAAGRYDMAIASHTPGVLPLWFVGNRFSQENNVFRVSDLKPYQAHIEQVRTAAGEQEKEQAVSELATFLKQERPFIPLWFSTSLHVRSKTVENIDYTAASYSNENVWAWNKIG